MQKAAAFVRQMAPGLKATYEIALAILFLDKLGESRDDAMIEMLAMRLIAGQTPTGGWTYKCPILERPDQKLLLSLLKKLAKPELFDPVRAADARLDMTLQGNLGMNDPLSATYRRKGIERNGVTPLPNAPSSSPDGSPVTHPYPAKSAPRLEPASPTASRNWAWCIKMEDSGAALPPPPTKVTIPSRFRGLPVFWPTAQLPVADPKDKGELPIMGTSDNSNTHFAILALWTAQRHKIPTARTMNLVAKRFYTSQNKDGSWGYHYVYGGGDPERPPMTCVGLLGLAVAHGLAHDIDPSLLRMQDPWILDGLVALSKNVGTHQGRTDNLPMANLYFLWAIERVGVLYDLPTIGNKDWYRWGAEILIANQRQAGHWDNGGYWGAKPISDTCMALLFLKRANLTREQTAKIAFRSDDLLMALAKRIPNEPISSGKTGSLDKHTKKAPPPVLKEDEKTGEPEEVKQNLTQAVAPPVRRAAPVAEPIEEPPGNGRLWFLAILLLLILCGVGLVLLARDKEEEDDAKPRRGRRLRNQVGG